MNPTRPIATIRHDLASAESYQRRYQARLSEDPLVKEMRDDNERDIEQLQSELALALSGDLELSLDGVAVDDHRVSVPYFNRVLETLQATYRAVLGSITSERLRRTETTLAISGTAPGSFRVMLTLPPAQLELIEDPVVDRGMGIIVDRLTAAAAGNAAVDAPEWASRADELAVRGMVRLAVALASSGGTTIVRWRPVNGHERLVRISAPAARSLAIALTGEVGREIITVTGHLEMAQDRPPRVRVRTIDDDYMAKIDDPDMLERVKDLLFEEVRATLLIDARTSATTGSSDISIELIELDSAPEVSI